MSSRSTGVTGRAAAVAVAAVAVLGLLGPVPARAVTDQGAADATARAHERRVLGTSERGRPIVARHLGDPQAPVQLVVLGQMHGNEPGGRRVVEELSERRMPPGVGVWLVSTMNPDGARRGTRQNADGVDLNRNFPQSWRPGSRGTYWPGPRAASEPETRAMMRFLEAVRPTAVLSFHQAYDVVDISQPLSAAAGRQLAQYMGEEARRVGCPGPCHGTMTQWIDRELRTIAITVELDGSVSDREAARAATAVLRLGRWLGR